MISDPAMATPAAEQGSSTATTTGNQRRLGRLSSKPNLFGIIRRYALPVGTRLTHDPDGALTLSDLTDIPKRTIQETPAEPQQATQKAPDEPQEAQKAPNEPQEVQKAPNEPRKAIQKPSANRRGIQKASSPPAVPQKPEYGPFSTKTAFSLADWYWNSTNKSFNDFQKLVGILSDPSFSLNDATSVNWRSIFKTLGSNKEDLTEITGDWIEDDGWKTTPISIKVPFHNRMKNKGTEDYVLGKLRHRNIVSVIKEKILNPSDNAKFHYYPYQAVWKPDGTLPEVELYGEFYYSREFRAAHEKLQEYALPGPNSNLERVVVALMFWSDATHLTSFGTAYLWPCYLFFGNESKYRRCKPSEGLGNHIAYFEKVRRVCPHPRVMRKVDAHFSLQAPGRLYRLPERAQQWQDPP